MVKAIIRYEKETGKPLDEAKFGEFMQTNKITDPNKAYEMFTEPERREKQINDEVAKRVADEMTKRNVPGVTGSDFAPSEKGHLQLRIEGAESAYKIPEGAELGDRTAAVISAKELRAEGAF
jgi:hypothetical protein